MTTRSDVLTALADLKREVQRQQNILRSTRDWDTATIVSELYDNLPNAQSLPGKARSAVELYQSFLREQHYHRDRDRRDDASTAMQNQLRSEGRLA